MRACTVGSVFLAATTAMMLFPACVSGGGDVNADVESAGGEAQEAAQQCLATEGTTEIALTKVELTDGVSLDYSKGFAAVLYELDATALGNLANLNQGMPTGDRVSSGEGAQVGILLTAHPVRNYEPFLRVCAVRSDDGNVWQKQRCQVIPGRITITSDDCSKQPTGEVNLQDCKLKGQLQVWPTILSLLEQRRSETYASSRFGVVFDFGKDDVTELSVEASAIPIEENALCTSPRPSDWPSLPTIPWPSISITWGSFHLEV
jgi:hypothetical protein